MRVITGRNVNLKLIPSDTIHNIAEIFFSIKLLTKNSNSVHFDARLIKVISKYGNRRSLLFLYWKEKFELWGKLFLRIKSV